LPLIDHKKATGDGLSDYMATTIHTGTRGIIRGYLLCKFSQFLFQLPGQ